MKLEEALMSEQDKFPVAPSPMTSTEPASTTSPSPSRRRKKAGNTTPQASEGTASEPQTDAPATPRRRKKTQSDTPPQTSNPENTVSPPDIPQPRLRKLKIRNLRSIGAVPVEIELDRIVVLVGPNNAGKSTILFAYQLIMSHGSKEDKLDLSDFPGSRVDEHNLPEIEIEFAIHESDQPGERWIQVDPNSKERIIRERWIWHRPNDSPRRQGYDVQKGGTWAEDGVPWGAPSVAKARRPEPHRVNAFDPPEIQANAVAKLLLEVVTDRLRAKRSPPSAGSSERNDSEYSALLTSIAALQKNVVEQARAQIDAAERKLSAYVSEIFQGYEVKFDARPEHDLEKALSLFKSGAQLRMGQEGEHQTPLDRQGSGARRTLMWAALRYLADNNTNDVSSRPHLLLLDEPELCLHPNAIRQACRVLYELASQENWQVMITTHSPVFIDLSRDNTTIVRVIRTPSGEIKGTTVFRSDRSRLAHHERSELKLLNLCDPTVHEFFFGGRTIIVEGDTEYTALKYVIANSQEPERYRDVHIIRARGKVMVALLARIINQFGGEYAVLHDSDTPVTGTEQNDSDKQANSAWTHNRHILTATRTSPRPVRHLALVPNFELAILNTGSNREKPYNALQRIREERSAFDKVERLLQALLDPSIDPPDWCIVVDSISTIQKTWHAWNLARATSAVLPPKGAQHPPTTVQTSTQQESPSQTSPQLYFQLDT